MNTISRKNFPKRSAAGLASMPLLSTQLAPREALAATGGARRLDVATVALGGSGTEAAAWIGWESAVNAAPPFTTMYFPSGFYATAETIALNADWRLIEQLAPERCRRRRISCDLQSRSILIQQDGGRVVQMAGSLHNRWILVCEVSLFPPGSRTGKIEFRIGANQTGEENLNPRIQHYSNYYSDWI